MVLLQQGPIGRETTIAQPHQRLGCRSRGHHTLAFLKISKLGPRIDRLLLHNALGIAEVETQHLGKTGFGLANRQHIGELIEPAFVGHLQRPPFCKARARKVELGEMLAQQHRHLAFVGADFIEKCAKTLAPLRLLEQGHYQGARRNTERRTHRRIHLVKGTLTDRKHFLNFEQASLLEESLVQTAVA